MRVLVPSMMLVVLVMTNVTVAQATWWPSPSKGGTKTKLLDCNVQGPNQQVTVVRDRGQLFLEELTSQGHWIQRELTQQEWDSKLLRLQMDEDGEQTELNARDPFYYVLMYSAEEKRWFFDYRVPGWRQMGMADCW